MIRAVDPLISLPATDPARAHRFYTDVLGLEPLVELHEQGFHIFRGSHSESPVIGLHAHEGALPPAEAQGVWCWLKVNGLDEARARLEAAGVTILGEPTGMGPGRELRFLDSEGNVLRLYEGIREVRRSIEIDAPANAIFHALTDPDTIERWFSTIDDVELDARVGGAVSFIDPAFGRVRGRVTAIETGRRIAFEFDENWPRSLEVTLSPVAECTREGNCTMVELVQTGFDQVEDRDFGIPDLLDRIEDAADTLRQVMLAAE
jgi:uncharacterized protein YndB with AHSA1/START domain/predicted enzyme related to lactoylglutathione lyase